MAKKNQNWKAIEIEYLHSPEKLSLKDIADKYGVNYGTLTNRAARENWRQMRENLESKIAFQNHQEMLSQRQQFVSGINRCAGLLLQQIEVICGRSEGLSSREIAAIASSLKQLKEINSDSDLGKSLANLIDNGVIPPNLYPQILETLDNQETQLLNKMGNIFRSNCPD